MSDPSFTLIFHHIPKAAGSVFSSSVAVYFPESSVFRMDYVKTNDERPQYIARLSEAERAKYKLILGHMPFGVHRLLPNPTKYFAFVRQPVKRVLSLCRFIQSRDHHYLNPRLKEAGSIAAFVRSGCTIETHNEMVRYFCEKEQIFEDEPVTERHLEIAIENIEAHIPSVGLSEKYDESVVVFSKLYGLPAPFYIRRNKSKAAPASPAEDDIEAIREANQQDIALYHYLEKRFQQQVDDLLAQDPGALRRFQRANAGYGRFVYLARGGLRKMSRALKPRF